MCHIKASKFKIIDLITAMQLAHIEVFPMPVKQLIGWQRLKKESQSLIQFLHIAMILCRDQSPHNFVCSGKLYFPFHEIPCLSRVINLLTEWNNLIHIYVYVYIAYLLGYLIILWANCFWWVLLKEIVKVGCRCQVKQPFKHLAIILNLFNFGISSWV